MDIKDFEDKCKKLAERHSKPEWFIKMQAGNLKTMMDKHGDDRDVFIVLDEYLADQNET